MSVEAMTWAFSVPLPPCPKSVLVALANRADEDGNCWPGIDDLERRTGWKRRAIQLAIRQLVKDQLLTVSARFQSSLRQDSNLYQIKIGRERPTTACGEGAPDARGRVHQVHGEGAPGAPPRVHHMHGEGAPHAPKSSSEQSEEQSSHPVAAAPVVVSPGKSSAVWEGYRAAYKEKYGVDPVRNKTVNGQLCRLVDKLGAEEAPLVAAFYLTCTKAVYVSNKHPCMLLLRDAEGLRTEWAMGPTAPASPPQAKCIWVNGGGCLAYASPGSRYCQPHGDRMRALQDRRKADSPESLTPIGNVLRQVTP